MSRSAPRPPMHMGEQSMDARAATECARLLDYHVPRLLRQQLGTRESREQMRAAIRETRQQIGSPRLKPSKEPLYYALSDDERAEILRLHKETRLPLKAIAKQVGRSVSCVSRCIIASGSKRVNKSAAIRSMAGKTPAEIADAVGVSLAYVYEIQRQERRRKERSVA